ncbi:MAG: PIN domain-containing protein [Vicinamibacteria bacterium]|nr:PIN domain-containing protein [Vicinamibacteria bacterium]
MSVFVDTSGLLAVLDADDAFHPRADVTWRKLLASDRTLVTTNYVLVETFALAQSRLGLDAVRALQQDVVPALRVLWVDGELHGAGATALLTAGRRRLSLVDCVSFEVMRREGMRQAFCFDRHFAEQGFETAR